MEVPERISTPQLQEAYSKVGLQPSADEPFTFERSDGFAEELQEFEDSVADEFEIALFEFFNSNNDES